MLELLQAQGRMNGAELAQRLGVDRRTVRRYVAMLEELGIPVTAERGRDGAYMLVAGFKLPPMMFTDDEAVALSVGLLAARGLGLAEASTAVGSAQSKLERVMPSSVKRRVRAIDETVRLDLARPAAPNDADTATIGALSGAARTQTRVRLRYRAARGDEAERNFDPYGLVYRGGRWYAVGFCHLRGGVRSFRLDRVQSVRLLEAGFSKPAGFDALAHLTLSIATLPRAHTVEVILETDLTTAQRELFPAAGVLEQAGRSVLLRSQVDDLRWFARELARVPFGFEIRRPAALRAALESHAGNLLRRAPR